MSLVDLTEDSAFAIVVASTEVSSSGTLSTEVALADVSSTLLSELSFSVSESVTLGVLELLSATGGLLSESSFNSDDNEPPV